MLTGLMEVAVFSPGPVHRTWAPVRRSVSKVVRIALLVSDNSTATVAVFTAVTH
jgi:hypothetical protein